MLAASQVVQPNELHTLPLPMWGTPKFDGIRAQVFPKYIGRGRNRVKHHVAMSRKHIEIPNCHIQEWMDDLQIPIGCDGELIAMVPDESQPDRRLREGTFNECQSKIMSNITAPFSFIYYVFDRYIDIGEHQWEYRQRLIQLERMFDAWPGSCSSLQLVKPVRLATVDAILEYEHQQVDILGREGIILRKGSSEYKHGRATRNECTFLKMKRFEDAEAQIIGFRERLKNNNKQTRDKTGYAKRSKHKANLEKTGLLGAFLVKDIETGKRFEIGSGFDQKFARRVWNNQADYKGEIICYKKQIHGEKDRPRSPIFKGLRFD